MNLDQYMAHAPWVVATAVGLPVLAKVVVSLCAMRGSSAAERPAILRAVGDMFRPWRRGDDPK